jgi:hypothetical protein
MKGLGVHEGTDGTNAVIQVDELVAGVDVHNSVLRETGPAKRKTKRPDIAV